MAKEFDPRSLRGCVAVAVVEGSDLSTEVGAHFGRSPRFILVRGGAELSVQAIENPNVEAAHGAGPATASLLIREGVTAVVAGQFGPKAETALRAGGILPVVVRPGTGLREALAGVEMERVPDGS
jgi:predicted Fe-Mo cluster-binding NifX family protein